MKTLIIATFVLANVFAYASPHAGKSLTEVTQAWERLGSRAVTMTADHDEILVSASDGVYTAVQLRIAKAPIHLNNINIIFGNGDNENVVFDQNFPAGSETRIIDLPGNKRVISKVNLNYRSVPTQKGKSVVSLWGRH